MHEKNKYRYIPWNRYNLEKYHDIHFWSYRPALTLPLSYWLQAHIQIRPHPINNQWLGPGARFNKEVQPTLSLNLNSELSYSEMGNSEFSVTEQLNCVSLLNSN